MSKYKRQKSEPEQIADLKEEITQLKKQAGVKKSPSKPIKWRSVIAIVLIVLGSLLSPFAVAANWLNLRVVDTDAYVETVAPLSEDPAIQNAVANYITTQLFAQVDVEKQAKQALPPQAQFLAGPLTSQIESFADKEIKKILASDKFNQLWSQANRIAHQLIINLVLNKTGVITSKQGEVSLDLSTLLDAVKSNLKDRGIDIFDNVTLEKGQKFTIFKSSALAKVQQAISILNKLAILLPILALAFFIGAIILFTDRRIAILWVGLGLALSMIVLPIGIAIGKNIYLSAITSNVFPESAAAAVYDTIFQSLRSVGRAFFLLGVIISAGAFLVGPSSIAVKTRQRSKDLLQRLGKDKDFGTLGAWVAEHKAFLRVTGLIVGLIILFLLKEITIPVVIGILLVYLVFLGAIEILGK